MTPRLFFMAAGLAALALVAAGVAVVSRDDAVTVARREAPAFPLLVERAESVATIELTTPAISLVLAADGSGIWRVTNRDGYAANPDPVRELVVTLAEMQLVEPKTARADRFARLGVEGPEVAGASSGRVRLLDAAGEVLADTVLGRRIGRVVGATRGGTYIRRAGDGRAWLASGRLVLRSDFADWLAPGILDIERGRVRRIEVRRVDEAPWVALRNTPAAGFRIPLAPADRTTSASALDLLGRLLANLTLEDVRTRAGFAAPRDAAGTPAPEDAAETIITTFDGVEIRVRSTRTGDERWIRLDFRQVPALGAGGDGTAAGDLVADGRARLSGWAFRISGFAADRLAPPLEDLLAPPGES